MARGMGKSKINVRGNTRGVERQHETVHSKHKTVPSASTSEA